MPENNELELENYELSDLEDDDDDDDQLEGEATPFDVETCEFVEHDTGFYKMQDDDAIFNEDGEQVGEIIYGEFVAC